MPSGVSAESAESWRMAVKKNHAPNDGVLSLLSPCSASACARFSGPPCGGLRGRLGVSCKEEKDEGSACR